MNGCLPASLTLLDPQTTANPSCALFSSICRLVWLLQHSPGCAGKRRVTRPAERATLAFSPSEPSYLLVCLYATPLPLVHPAYRQ